MEGRQDGEGRGNGCPLVAASGWKPAVGEAEAQHPPSRSRPISLGDTLERGFWARPTECGSPGSLLM